MNKKTSSVRTPIWADQPQYDLRQIELNSENLQILATLGSVLAAKLNVTPPGFQSYLNVAAAAALLPDDAAHADLPSMLTFLDSACAEQGIGVTIALCMLARLKQGKYPPVDRKIASGRRACGDISAEEEKVLSGPGKGAAARRVCAQVYVERLIPAWRRDKVGRSPLDTDKL